MPQNEAFARENIAYWTGRAPGYSQVNRSELSSGQRAVWRGVLDEQIGLRFPGRAPQTLSVLDVGTGPGFFAILLAEQGFRVTAVDYTDSMLRQARRNAGSLADGIDFLRMDAEDLAFPDGQFDLVLSRNVTWNLHDPQRAYREWTRVLRAGGLLLNFDANWYRYLYDECARSGHVRDRQNVTRARVDDDTAGTDVRAMEAIALQTPLSRQLRPEWDAEALARLGMDVRVHREIWQRVWTREEWVNNASTPLFMIAAVKRPIPAR